MSTELVASHTALRPLEPLRVAVVGCNLGRHRYHAALKATSQVQVVGLVDAELDVARAWGRALGSRMPVFTELAALFATDLPIDAVLVSSSLRERAGHTRAVLDAGKPVLCEVPVAPTLTDTDALLKVAAENVLLMPALFRRVDPFFRAIAAQIESGMVGEVRQVRCEWSFPVGGAATLESGANPGDSWLVLMQHLACQTADICRWWLGEALTVSADIDLPEQSVPSKTGGGRQPRQMALANLIVAQERGQSTHHLLQSRAQEPEERYHIAGTLGSLDLTVSSGERNPGVGVPFLNLTRLGQRPETLPIALPPDHATLPISVLRTRELLLHFAACIQRKAPPQFSGLDMRKALEIVHAGFVSTREANKVSLPLRRTSGKKDNPPPSSPRALPPG